MLVFGSLWATFPMTTEHTICREALRRTLDLPTFLNNNGIDLYVPIGSVDIVPSRDDLQYTEKTKQALANAIEAFLPELRTAVNELLKSAPTEWEAVKLVRSLNTIKNLDNIITGHLSWNGLAIDHVKGVVRSVAEFKLLDSTLTLIKQGNINARARIASLWDNSHTDDSKRKIRMHPTQNTYLVLNDINDEKETLRIMRAMMRDKLISIDRYTGRAAKYGHEQGEGMCLTTKLSVKSISTFFGNMPVENVLLASVLKKEYTRDRANSTSEKKRYTDTIYKYVWNEDKRTEKWIAGVEIPTGNGPFYYVPLEQHGGKRYRYASSVRQMQDLAFEFEMGAISIYGIKQEEVVDFDASVWFDIRDALNVRFMIIAKGGLPTLIEYLSSNEDSHNNDIWEVVENVGLADDDTKIMKAYVQGVRKSTTKTELPHKLEIVHDRIFENYYGDGDGITDVTVAAIRAMTAGVKPLNMGKLEVDLLKAYPLVEVLCSFVDGSADKDWKSLKKYLKTP